MRCPTGSAFRSVGESAGALWAIMAVVWTCDSGAQAVWSRPPRFVASCCAVVLVLALLVVVQVVGCCRCCCSRALIRVAPPCSIMSDCLYLSRHVHLVGRARLSVVFSLCGARLRSLSSHCMLRSCVTVVGAIPADDRACASTLSLVTACCFRRSCAYVMVFVLPCIDKSRLALGLWSPFHVCSIVSFYSAILRCLTSAHRWRSRWSSFRDGCCLRELQSTRSACGAFSSQPPHAVAHRSLKRVGVVGRDFDVASHLVLRGRMACAAKHSLRRHTSSVCAAMTSYNDFRSLSRLLSQATTGDIHNLCYSSEGRIGRRVPLRTSFYDNHEHLCLGSHML